MKSYLYAVQDATGREVCSAHLTVKKVSEVTVARAGGVVELLRGGKSIASGADPGGDLALHRWRSDDKLSRPVRHRVR